MWRLSPAFIAVALLGAAPAAGSDLPTTKTATQEVVTPALPFRLDV
jgi:hypothetical protein